MFGGSDTASGLVQATAHDKPWLWAGFAGLAVALAAWRLPAGRTQGHVLLARRRARAGRLAARRLRASARTGWSFEFLEAWFGALPGGQFGIGLGGALVLLSLLMLLGAGIARLGYFRGDLFVAGAVVLCSALLLLFVALPVGKSLIGAFLDDAGQLVLGRAGRAPGPRARLGPGLPGRRRALRRGLEHAVPGLAHGRGHHADGHADRALCRARHRSGWARPLNVLALLPIITPPFVVGLGLILLFGRAGLVNQLLEWAFGITPTRWFYGLLGVWLAQMFAFTPIAFMIMRGVVQGISPSMEEAAQTLRASRLKTFTTVTLPLMKPGLANAFLVGFIESIADFGNPIIVGGQYAVLSTDIFFAIVGAQYDQGKAASLALILTAFALTVFFIQQRVLGKTSYTTVSGKGDAGMAMPLPDARAPPVPGRGRALAGLHRGGLRVRLHRRLRADLGPRLHAHAGALPHRLRPAVGRGRPGLGRHGVELAVHHAQAGRPSPRRSARPLGLLISWLLARTQFVGQRAFEFAALLAFAIPGTVLGVSYILAFNVPPFELTGTGLIIVLCFVFRNLPVGVRAGTASFKQLDKSLDEASTMLRAGTATTLRRVVLPLLKPALVAALVYSFVRSMTTVSAVIFLVTAENELATTYIIGRVGNGDYGVALAYCTVLIVLMSAATARSSSWSASASSAGAA